MRLATHVLHGQLVLEITRYTMHQVRMNLHDRAW